MLVTVDASRGQREAAGVAIASGALAGPTLPADKAATTLEGSAFTPQMSANFLEVAVTVILSLSSVGRVFKVTS